jgi:hypothetical protein
MAFHIQGGPACLAVILVTVVPGVVAALLFHSAWGLIGAPICILAIWAALGKWGRKRNVTPEKFADELESHLLGTGAWGWDDTTSLTIADERLDRLRRKLEKFDSLGLEERRNEFINIIAALRRGDVPEVKEDM